MEVINDIKMVAVNAVSLADRKNKIAVLPFHVVTNDQGTMVDELSMEVQEDVTNALREETTYGISRPVNDQNIIGKKRTKTESLSSLLPNEIADILGVEFVMIGSVDVVNKGTKSCGNTYSTVKGNEKQTSRNKEEIKGSVFSTSSESTSIDYDTKLSMRFYNDQGSNMHSDSRSVFGGGKDSYHNGVKSWLNVVCLEVSTKGKSLHKT